MSKLDKKNTSALTDEYRFPDQEVMLQVLGPGCKHIQVLQQELGLVMGQRGDTVHLKGEAEHVTAGINLIDQLVRASRKGRTFKEIDVVRAARILASDKSVDLDEIFNEVIHVTASRRLVTPKGLNQKRYVDAIRTKDLCFGIGPAGTGKTYLAVALAVAAWTQKRYRRIVLTRPAVEAGERLGFLPGDLVEKVNPYLRPLYDALDDMLGPEKTAALLTQGQIEIAPLAFMRGRTLNDAFVILDEAQNTTREQMMMFLTRLGYSSKAVVTGDVSQIDLPKGAVSGLVDASHVLRGVKEIDFIYFTGDDVVRHPLVQAIIRAYDRNGKGSGPGRKGGDADGEAES